MTFVADTLPKVVVLDDYFFQSSLVMTTRQLARAVRFLANDGIDPASGRRVLSAVDARRVTALTNSVSGGCAATQASTAGELWIIRSAKRSDASAAERTA